MTGSSFKPHMSEGMKRDKLEFERKRKIYESVLLTFKGVGDHDVYNCSIPFTMNGKRYIFGRVELNHEWANSHVRMFEETAKDEFTVVPNTMIFELEDPYFSNINDEMIFGGTCIRKNIDMVQNYHGNFYKGTPGTRLRYFTSGPDNMKDVRVVQLNDGTIGVFSRPRTETYAAIGFTTIRHISELGAAVVAEAEPLDVLEENTWGGVNQAYLLSSGKVGCIAHKSYIDIDPDGNMLSVYVNFSFVLDPVTKKVFAQKIIGTKSCYPECRPKVPRLADCVFSSGIVMRDDGKADLYSGVGDAFEGRITIDYPFEGYGAIVEKFDFS